MTTPSETRAGKLPELPECWTGSPVTVTWAEDGETTTREVYTAEQMHRYALEALAASEPVEAVVTEPSASGRRLTTADVYDDLGLIVQDPTDLNPKWLVDVATDAMHLLAPMVFASPAPTQAMGAVAWQFKDSEWTEWASITEAQYDAYRSGRCTGSGNSFEVRALYPAPEQPGKGEGGSRIDAWHDSGQRPGTWDAVDEALLCWYGHRVTFTQCERQRFYDAIQTYLKSTPQPSDPAEGDALQRFSELLQRLRGQLADSTSDFAYVIVRDYANELGDIFNALSTPQTAAVSVDDAMIRRFVDAVGSPYSFDMPPPRIIRTALTAALDPQVKR